MTPTKLFRRAPLALMLMGACTGAALAQSSVTVFGVLDLGVQRLTNGSSSRSLASIDGLQTSRLGFRGSEDLGGGLSASFHLEGAIGPDTGAGGDWRRRATVSIASKTAGELRLGRDYTPSFWNISRFNPFGTNGVGAASNLVYGFDGASSSAKTVVRSDNSVGYFLPGGLGGVYGQAMAAAGEGSTGKYLGMRLGYASGPLDVAVSVSDTTNTAAGAKFKVASLGASYVFSGVKLFGLVHTSKQLSKKQSNWVLGASYAIGKGTLRASYVSAHLTNAAPATDYKGQQLALGYVYALSKRTSLYGTMSRVSNSTTGKYLIPGGSSVLAGQGSRGTELGIYHSF